MKNLPKNSEVDLSEEASFVLRGAAPGRPEEQERLEALRRYDVLDTPPEEAFDRITRLAADRFDVPIALVTLVDRERQWPKSCYGTDLRRLDEEIDRAISFCHHAIASSEPMVVEDATADPRFSGNPLVTGEEHVRFYAGAPLVTPEGHVLGTLCVLGREPRGFSDEEQARLEDLAAMAMSEMEQRRARPEKTMARISAELLSVSADLDAVLALLGETVEADRAYLLERSDSGEPLARTHEWSGVPREPSGQKATERKETLAPETFPWWFEQLRQGEDPLHIQVPDLPPEAEAEQRYLAGQDIASLLDVPISRSDGTLYGVLGFEHTDPSRDWDRSDARVLRVASDLLAGHFEREQTDRALRESRDETEKLLGGMTDAFFALDANWNFTYINDEAERVFERRREELLGQNLWEEFPDAVGTVSDEEYRRAVAEGEAVSFETFYAPLDVWVEVRAHPYEGGLSVFLNDINERKAAEQALQRSEKRFRALVERGSDVTAIVGTDGTIQYESPSVRRVLGYEPEALVGTNGLARVHPDDREDVEAGLEEVSQEPRGEVTLTFRMRHADGSWVHLEAIGRNFLGDSAIGGIVVNSRDVTERKKAEAKRRAAQRETEDVLESIGEALYAVDAGWRFTYVNDEAARLWGRDREELLGERLWEAFPEFVGSGFEEPLRRADREQKTVDAEVHTPHGRWAELHIYPRAGAEGYSGAQGLLVFFKDITARKEAEAELRLMQSAVESANDAVLIGEATLADGTGPEIVYVNEALEKQTGYRREEVVGQTPALIRGPEMGGTSQEIAEAIAERRPIRTELLTYRKDGSTFWAEVSIEPIRDENGAVTHWLSVRRDITERREREEALRESEETFRSVVENAQNVIFQTDAQGRWTLLSPSWEETMGYTVEEALGTSFMEYVHPADRSEELLNFKALAEGPEGAIRKDVRYVTQSGETRRMRFAARLVTDGEGRVSGTTGTFTDVTDSFEIEAERKARERAEELLEAKTSFLNNMSHELRTPLASIVGFAELLDEEEMPEAERREFAGRIAASGERLKKTLNSILELAQLESGGAGRAEMNIAPVDVAAQVRATTEAHRPAAEEKGLALRAKTPRGEGGDTRAALNEGAFGRVLDNLISNAIKFTEEGSVTLRVGATAQEVHVEVEDTGCGIEDDFLEGGRDGLFADFEQESKGLSRSHEGAGLGLAIAKRLTEEMDGAIDVASEKGEGTTFTVRFPRLAPAAEEGPASQKEQGGQAEGGGLREGPGGEDEVGPGKEPRVLLVEDNANTRALVERVFRGRCRLESAAGVEEALALAEEAAKEAEAASEASAPLDVLIIDINLSGQEDGIELLARLREGPGAPAAGVPAIAFTAHVTAGDAERYREAGFDGYLSKPFSKADLLETTREAVAARAAEKSGA
jgi:PAS domain S-box-containing protein